MLGIFVELLASWIILRLVEKQGLEPLGLGISRIRMKQFMFGFLLSVICSALYFVGFIYFSKTEITINEHYTLKLFFESILYTIKSVLYEELIFRGALLYIAIKRLGLRPSCMISAIAFGIYHWFSYGIFGQPIPMLYIFIITAIAGFIFAYAFGKTRSMYLPVALHLGWNLVTLSIFSQGPLGDQLLIFSNGQKMGWALSVILFLYQVMAMPLIVFWYLKTQGRKQEGLPGLKR